MARHAGFAAVATVTEQAANDAVASFVRNAGRFFFPAPQTINIGNSTVTIGGILEMLVPRIELHANVNDLVTVHFGFKGTI
ncbi:MAG: hypothetical protein ABI347_06320 [Nitrososphaera sp.]